MMTFNKFLINFINLRLNKLDLSDIQHTFQKEQVNDNRRS